MLNYKTQESLNQAIKDLNNKAAKAGLKIEYKEDIFNHLNHLKPVWFSGLIATVIGSDGERKAALSSNGYLNVLFYTRNGNKDGECKNFDGKNFFNTYGKKYRDEDVDSDKMFFVDESFFNICRYHSRRKPVYIGCVREFSNVIEALSYCIDIGVKQQGKKRRRNIVKNDTPRQRVQNYN